MFIYRILVAIVFTLIGEYSISEGKLFAIPLRMRTLKSWESNSYRFIRLRNHTEKKKSVIRQIITFSVFVKLKEREYICRK